MTKALVFLCVAACGAAISTPAIAADPCGPRAVRKEKPPNAEARKSAAPRADGVLIDVPAGVPVKEDDPPDGARASSALTACAAPAPLRAQSLFYLRLGETAMLGADVPGGPGTGLGYRMELERIGIDVGASSAVTDVTHGDRRAGEASWLKLTALYFFDPTADRSLYLGGGLSWGARTATVCEERFSGSGLQVELVGGYEMLRSSNLRLFVQADATLPLYGASAADTPALSANGDVVPMAGASTRFLPTIGISLGVAWGKPSCARSPR